MILDKVYLVIEVLVVVSSITIRYSVDILDITYFGVDVTDTMMEL